MSLSLCIFLLSFLFCVFKRFFVPFSSFIYRCLTELRFSLSLKLLDCCLYVLIFFFIQRFTFCFHWVFFILSQSNLSGFTFIFITGLRDLFFFIGSILIFRFFFGFKPPIQWPIIFLLFRAVQDIDSINIFFMCVCEFFYASIHLLLNAN